MKYILYLNDHRTQPIHSSSIHTNPPNSYTRADGIKLGLTEEEVSTPNFSWQTINAIKDIRKRTDVSVSEAFKIVSGKSINDTQKFVASYLKYTKKVQKSITEMNIIRVIVNDGRGFGHQRAAITLMQKLSEMGFIGTFDVQCSSQRVADKLQSMDKKYSKSKISLLPENYKEKNAFTDQADLAICAADDWTIIGQKDTIAKTYNALSYIGLSLLTGTKVLVLQ